MKIDIFIKHFFLMISLYAKNISSWFSGLFGSRGISLFLFDLAKRYQNLLEETKHLKK